MSVDTIVGLWELLLCRARTFYLFIKSFAIIILYFFFYVLKLLCYFFQFFFQYMFLGRLYALYIYVCMYIQRYAGVEMSNYTSLLLLLLLLLFVVCCCCLLLQVYYNINVEQMIRDRTLFVSSSFLSFIIYIYKHTNTHNIT